LVVEEARETRVPALGDSRDVPSVCGIGRVVVDQKMLGLENFELELLPQDLVAAEILRVRLGGPERERANREETADRGEDASRSRSDALHIVAPSRRAKCKPRARARVPVSDVFLLARGRHSCRGKPNHSS